MEQIYNGNIVFTSEFGELDIYENGYIVVDEEGKVKEVSSELSNQYDQSDVIDYGDKLIIPGMIDTHVHAPQFANRGLGLDKELLPWLETYTFPEESKYSDLDYAKEAYTNFVKELWKHGTTRSIIFATIHRESSELLMDLLNQAGLGALVGKVNMDRNSPDNLVETTAESLAATEKFITNTKDKYELIEPIITPRFVPSCSAELMEGLGELASKYDITVQSHISENQNEIDWVADLHPEAENYGAVYDQFGLFGQQPTVMAHGVYLTDEEIEVMADRNIFVSHCPHSNTDLASGIAPIRKITENDVPVGLASDVAGGHDISMSSVMTSAIQVSKLKWVESDHEYEPLSAKEVLYLATKGGGKFFGQVGSFEPGYEFDALVIDDQNIKDVNERTIEERIERYIYLGDERNIVDRFVKGQRLPEPSFQ
ncbi:MAG: guanine deaminase [Bacillota bacterium]